jgi:hypothetical protein
MTASAQAVDRVAEMLGARILERRPNGGASTFPSEILHCRTEAGREFYVLVKHTRRTSSHVTTSHRRGIGYEAAVYRHVLSALTVGAPAVYAFEDGPDGWLAVELLDRALPLDASPDPTAALKLAAAWAGRLHATAAGPPAVRELEFLIRYDSEYYLRWAAQTFEYAGAWRDRLPWLNALLTAVPAAVDELLAQPATVIHGEFTPPNVLVQDGRVHPVDWESAAVAIGEIDIAALTDKWPLDAARAAESAYGAARWPAGADIAFQKRLDLARLYWDLRWLGDRPEWTRSEKVRARLEHLRATGRRLGLIGAP